MNIDLVSLEAIYEKVAHHQLPSSAFVDSVEQMDWYGASASTLKNAIDFALALELPFLARKLSSLGAQLHPTDPTLEKLSRILAPPVASVSTRPANPALAQSTRWYRENAEHYRGQWVALKGDTLIGAAASRDEIVAKYKLDQTDPTLVVTWIP